MGLHWQAAFTAMYVPCLALLRPQGPQLQQNWKWAPQRVRPPLPGQSPHQCTQKNCSQLSWGGILWRYGLFHFGSLTAQTSWSPSLWLLTNRQTLCLLRLVSSCASWGSRTALPQSFFRWARTPHKGSESPSPSLPPPLHLAEQREQQVPSGRVVKLRPKLSAAINTRPQTQQEPCWLGDGSSVPASQRVLTVAVPSRERSWQTSPPAMLGLSVGGRGKEAALSFITDGSAWRDSQQHLSSRQLCDFARCCWAIRQEAISRSWHHSTSWVHVAQVCGSDSGARRMLWVPLGSRSSPSNIHGICSWGRRNALSSGMNWRTGRTACHWAWGTGGSWGQYVVGALGELLWLPGRWQLLCGVLPSSQSSHLHSCPLPTLTFLYNTWAGPCRAELVRPQMRKDWKN